MITPYINGRLGNQLFQYVFARIAANINKCNYCIPSNIEDATNLYNNCIRKFNFYVELPNYPLNPHFWTGDKIFNVDLGFNDNYLNQVVGELDISQISDGMFLYGFFQSESYMLPYENEIKNNWLIFKDELKEKSQPIINKYKPEEYCYIHFRGGDYKTIDKYFLPKSYYENAILKIKEEKANIKFLIITDDLEESKKMFPEFESISNSVEEDFYMLTQAKYMIIPNSSFSWWAAWLNQNEPITIAPDRWFNYNSGDNFDPIGIKCSKFTYI